MALKDGDTIPDALEGVSTSWDAVSAPPATSRDLLLASAQGWQCMSNEGYDKQLPVVTRDRVTCS